MAPGAERSGTEQAQGQQCGSHASPQRNERQRNDEHRRRRCGDEHGNVSQAGERRIRSAQLVSKALASSATPPPTVPARSGGTAGPANSTVPSHTSAHRSPML